VHVAFAAAFFGTVAKPGLPLIALRTVGRETPVIAANAPNDILVQLIQERVRGFEPAYALEIVVHDAAFERVETGRAGESSDLDKAESVVGEPGFIDLFAFSLENVGIHAFGAPKVCHVQRAVFLEGLGVPQAHGGPARTLHLQAAPAHHVLSHVVYEDAGREFVHADRRTRLDHPYGRGHLRRERTLRSRHGSTGRKLLSSYPGFDHPPSSICAS